MGTKEPLNWTDEDFYNVIEGTPTDMECGDPTIGAITIEEVDEKIERDKREVERLHAEVFTSGFFSGFLTFALGLILYLIVGLFF